MQPELRVGTIEITYFDWDTPDTRKNAFTTVTTWASDSQEFMAKCKRMLEGYGWQLLGVEKANPASILNDFSDEVTDMLELTRVNRDAIIYGTFYTYPVM